MFCLVSAWQQPDPYGPEAREHPLRESWLVHRNLPKHQAIRTPYERHPRQADRLRIRNLRLGTPLHSCVDTALQAAGGYSGAWLEPALWCLEHWLHYIRALSGKHFFLIMWYHRYQFKDVYSICIMQSWYLF